ncbi:hypothetical protein MBLNU13_g06565t1 [Cladosporium sp. NU13]
MANESAYLSRRYNSTLKSVAEAGDLEELRKIQEANNFEIEMWETLLVEWEVYKLEAEAHQENDGIATGEVHAAAEEESFTQNMQSIEDEAESAEDAELATKEIQTPLDAALQPETAAESDADAADASNSQAPSDKEVAKEAKATAGHGTAARPLAGAF